MATHEPPTVVPARLDDLVLGRLATAPRPMPHAAVVQALRAFAPTAIDGARWSTAIFEATARLTSAGLIDEHRRAVAGAEPLAARFPAAGSVTWPRLQGQLVPGLALDIPTDDRATHARLKGRDQWVAATIGRALGLWSDGPLPRLASVCDALVWRALGLPPPVRRTPPAIRAHFLSQLLGAGTGAPERRAALLAARETGAVRSDIRALREALVRRWLCAQRWGVPAPVDFGAAVQAAADRATTGQFGPRKVFISAVWRDPVFAHIPWPTSSATCSRPTRPARCGWSAPT
ncbi:MAG: hypothetical protein IPL61_16510 [Myxococcales bacterium]|nr:hypothetical protein [Myxococcales bacterium]